MAGFQRMQRPARESVRTAAKAGLSNPAVPWTGTLRLLFPGRKSVLFFPIYKV
jgi:hypothetical protein